MRFAGLLAIAAALLLLACSGDDPPAATPTNAPASPTPPAEVSPSPAPTSPAPPTQAAVEKVALTIWLVDVASGGMTTLVEDYDRPGWGAYFGHDGLTAFAVDFDSAAPDTTKFALRGTRLATGTYQSFCPDGFDPLDFPPRSFERFACRAPSPLSSPDGRWQLAQEGAPGSLEYALWAEDTQSGRRFLLQDGLQHCGGCDARFGLLWSPSGRYVVFAESGGEGRSFLSDLEGGLTVRLGNGNEVDDAPQWSPSGDVLLRPSASGTTLIEELATGVARELPNIAWPARFDASGRYVYSPGFATGNPAKSDERQETIVADLATGDVVAALSGVLPSLHLWRDFDALVATPAGVVAALEYAEGCDGTMVYLDGAAIACVERGKGASVSPDGSKLAVAVEAGATGPVEFPGGGAVSLSKYDIVVLDVATGDEKLVAADALGAVGEQPPELTWNGLSTHLLVRWPVHSGL